MEVNIGWTDTDMIPNRKRKGQKNCLRSNYHASLNNIHDMGIIFKVESFSVGFSGLKEVTEKSDLYPLLTLPCQHNARGKKKELNFLKESERGHEKAKIE